MKGGKKMAIKLIKATATEIPIIHRSYTILQWNMCNRTNKWIQVKELTPVVKDFWEISPRELAVITAGNRLYIVKLVDNF